MSPATFAAGPWQLDMHYAYVQQHMWIYGNHSASVHWWKLLWKMNWCALCQASCAKEVRYAILFDISERIVGLRYRRFGTIYRILLKGRDIQKAKDFFDFLSFENGIDILSRNFKKLISLQCPLLGTWQWVVLLLQFQMPSKSWKIRTLKPPLNQSTACNTTICIDVNENLTQWRNNDS
jgi:hypothetical protein